LLRGRDVVGRFIPVNIVRKSPPDQPPPTLARDERLILLLKQVRSGEATEWTVIGIENGSKAASPELVGHVKDLVSATGTN
jgi:hypothetical protein